MPNFNGFITYNHKKRKLQITVDIYRRLILQKKI